MTMVYLVLAVVTLAALVVWVIVRQTSHSTDDHDVNSSSARAESSAGPGAWS